jgi:hypothetical protein
MSVSSSVALSQRGKRKTKSMRDAEAIQAYEVIVGLLQDAQRHGGSLSPRHAEVFIQAVKEQNALAGLAKPVTQHLEVAMTVTGSIDSELDALAAELGMNDPAAATAPPADQSLGAT